MLRIFFLSIAVGVLAGCEPAATEVDVITNVFGTAKNLDLMRTATKVTACRIKPRKVSETPSDQQQRNYEEGPFVEVSPKQAARFQAVFASPETYLFTAAKGCDPVFGVRVRFESNAGVVDIDLCFDCLILLVTQGGKMVGGEDFDFGAAELTALCKELFPDDPEIQAIQPR